MTTEAAARLYESQHLLEMEGRGWAVVNPKKVSITDLPVIYGFNNGGNNSWYEAVLVAEDGVFLGSHICSSEAYMPHDLGILEGSRPDRHETFLEHFPNGYRMVFVESNEIETNEQLQVAFRKNKEWQEREALQNATKPAEVDDVQSV
jgi:hypothetical protein